MAEFATYLKESGLNLAEFCRITETPRRTAEDWKSGKTRAPGIVFSWFEQRKLIEILKADILNGS